MKLNIRSTLNYLIISAVKILLSKSKILFSKNSFLKKQYNFSVKISDKIKNLHNN